MSNDTESGAPPGLTHLQKCHMSARRGLRHIQTQTSHWTEGQRGQILTKSHTAQWLCWPKTRPASHYYLLLFCFPLWLELDVELILSAWLLPLLCCFFPFNFYPFLLGEESSLTDGLSQGVLKNAPSPHLALDLYTVYIMGYQQLQTNMELNLSPSNKLP